MYAKILSRYSIDQTPPKSAYINGRLVVGTLPESYLNSIGFYLYEPVPAPEPSEGHYMVPCYELVDGHVVETWEEVESQDESVEQNRSLSKRKLYRALSDAGIWEQVKGYMVQNGVWEDWEYATTLDENDPLIKAAIVALRDGLGIDPEIITQVINSSVINY